jgi:predicted alpha/beta hydrolase
MTPFSITTADGTTLGALRFEPSKPARGTALFAGATGVPQGFYRALAEHLREHGYRAITFDYRGIGRSRPGHLKGFHADYLLWAEQDLAAAVEVAASDGPITLIAHSFGGHALGLLPRQELIREVFSYGVGAGNMRYMAYKEWPPVLLMWYVLGPLLTKLYGYLPGRFSRLGEDLPLGVYRQWKHWCSLPRYWFDDPRYDMATRFATVRAPMTVVSSSDDAWAPHASVDLFHSFFTGALIERVLLDPAAQGLKRITHMGVFRREQAALWPLVLKVMARGDRAVVNRAAVTSRVDTANA